MIVKREMPTPAGLKYRYSELTARGALATIAGRFGGVSKRFTWAGHSYTVDNALAEIDDCLLDLPCGSFGVVGFGGGPPNLYRQFQGTLLTMICDFALFDYFTGYMSDNERLNA